MTASYRLDIFTPARVLLDSLGWETVGDDPARSGFITLTCKSIVNAPDQLVAVFPADHLIIQNLEDRTIVELWEENKDKGIAFHRYFSGIYRTPRFEKFGPEGRFTLIANGDISLLDWRIVNYYSGYTDRSKFISDPAETIMKTLVDYNITSLATTGNGRKRNGTAYPATEFDTEADAVGGNTLDWFCHGDNLLKTIQEIADVGGGDFSVEKNASSPLWTFKFHVGQLGIDRTSTVTFSVERDNMDDLEYELNRTKERTVACIWGSEEGANREYRTRTGTNYGVNNDREVYVNATGVNTDAGQDSRGDAKLSKLEAREKFDFAARTVQLYVFNKDVFLGDLVNVVNPYTGVSLDGKVHEANLVLTPTTQRISLEVKTD